MQLVVQDDQRAELGRFAVRRHDERGKEVRRPIRAGERGIPHRSREDDRRTWQQERERVGGLFDRVRAVRDDDAVATVVERPLGFERERVHVGERDREAGDRRDIADLDLGDAGEVGDALDDLARREAGRCGSSAGCGKARNRAADREQSDPRGRRHGAQVIRARRGRAQMLDRKLTI